MKICSICKKEKPYSEFWKRKARKSGYASACKCCSNKKRYEKKQINWEHHITVRKQWYEKNKEKQIEKQKLYNKYKLDETKQIARRKLNDALKLRKIEKPKNCQLCNKKTRLEAHHADYTKPLEVVWVCKKCHVKIHK